MIVVQLVASPFFGGPERQMIGLATALLPDVRTVFCLYRNRGKSQEFRGKLEENGLEYHVLDHDTPHLWSMVSELAKRLRSMSADVLCCHGYKADVVGLLATRRLGLPIVSVSRGWTWETWRVRLYERLDRACLPRMDRVVCVSEGQAIKVRKAGVATGKVTTIRNAIGVERFARPDLPARDELLAMFPRPPQRIVGSAGRLSPEKGFGVLVEAAAIVAAKDSGVAFIHFGDGRLRQSLEARIKELGIADRFVLTGFRGDLDRFLPHWDVLVLPSFTEGLPNVVLESYAAGVPVVATAVGGTPEVVADGVDGYLVPPGDPSALAGRILDILGMGVASKDMGRRGQDRIKTEFTFGAQAQRYRQLFRDLLGEGPSIGTSPEQGTAR